MTSGALCVYGAVVISIRSSRPWPSRSSFFDCEKWVRHFESARRGCFIKLLLLFASLSERLNWESSPLILPQSSLRTCQCGLEKNMSICKVPQALLSSKNCPSSLPACHPSPLATETTSSKEQKHRVEWCVGLRRLHHSLQHVGTASS